MDGTQIEIGADGLRRLLLLRGRVAMIKLLKYGIHELDEGERTLERLAFFHAMRQRGRWGTDDGGDWTPPGEPRQAPAETPLLALAAAAGLLGACTILAALS